MPTTSTDPRRRLCLIGATSFALAAALPGLAGAHGAAAHLQMWSTEGCDCCVQWAKHLRNYQFDVTQREVEDVAAVRKQLGMPKRYAGCHVARAGRYVIDGHVPALDFLRLMREQSQAIGLAVPDMPVGSPGMERGGTADPYQVLLVGLDASSTVSKSYP